MGFYQSHILPHLLALAMRNGNLVPYRERIVSQASGRVLEVGIGAGANLPFYRPHAHRILGLEPSARLIAMARRTALESRPPLSLIEASAASIPLGNGSIDSVVLTWTLCSVPDAVGALREIRRVLRPGGRLLFAEHGLAPDARIRQWQHRLTPWWRRMAGGCHLNRAMDALIESNGFKLDQLTTGYMPGPRPMTFMYEGSAIPA